MPMTPTDKAKAASHTAAQKAARAAERAAEAERRRKSDAAMEELRIAAALKLGVDPDTATMFVCRRGRR